MRPALLALFSVLVCLAVALPAPALPPAGDTPLAVLEATPATLVWQPRQDVTEWSLRVTAPGGAVLAFESRGAAPVLTAQDLRDALGELPDGSYTYELSAALDLDPVTRGEVESARATGAKPAWLLEAGRNLRQSGHFRVIDGRFVYDPDAVEPGTLEDDGGEAAQDTARRFPVGELTPLTTTEAPEVENQVITDDLVVRDSACVGADCPFSPAFGTDTIRLQESNLRIKFDDSTASGSGFPDRDWEILANEPNSGGKDLFAIHDVTAANVPFTIEGDGPDDSLYVASQGRVGLGTATPTQRLHLVDGDTPAVRIEQDATQSFPPQAWDVGGNEDEFFVRDVNNGNALPLRVEAGAPTDSLVVDTTGAVGLGTNQPSQMLHLVSDSGDARVLVQEFTTSTDPVTQAEFHNANGAARVDMVGQGVRWRMAADTQTGFFLYRPGSSAFQLRLFPDGDLTTLGTIEGDGLVSNSTLEVTESDATTTSRILGHLTNNGPVRFDMTDSNTGVNWSLRNLPAGFTIQLTGDPDTEFQLDDDGDLLIGGTLTQNSNRHTKTAIRSVDPRTVLQKVLALPIATWQRRGDEGVTHLGPMAQDFRALFGLGINETSISPVDMAGVALAAVQGLEERNEELSRENDELRQSQESLRTELDGLTERLAELEAKLSGR